MGLEEPRCGVIGRLRRPFGRMPQVQPYFVAPQLDISFQYPLFVVPRLVVRSSRMPSVQGSSKNP